jgi:hypothetical protein
MKVAGATTHDARIAWKYHVLRAQTLVASYAVRYSIRFRGVKFGFV